MNDPKAQTLIDARTWMPVAFFSWIEIPALVPPDAPPAHELHQLWVSALGQTEWRKVETRNLKEMAKAYAQCQAFSPREIGERDEDFDDRDPRVEPGDDTVPF